MPLPASEHAWLLHSRKYTDSKILLDLLVESGSLISGVYRVPKKNLMPQAFCALNVSWRGQHELKQIQNIESLNRISLVGTPLYCGLYLNELLLRLLVRDDPHSNIYSSYAQTLVRLASEPDVEPVLRNFEFSLLESLGYGIDFSCDLSGSAIIENAQTLYEFRFDDGFIKLDDELNGRMQSGHLAGSDIKKISINDFSEKSTLRAAKIISRHCFDKLLGGKELKSRELFRTE